MKTRRNAMKTTRRISICATSIAAFMAASPDSTGNSFNVNLGDTFIQGGVVTGATGLTLTGGGSLVLTNAGNNYTGVTTISHGTLVISDPAALGADASAIVVTGFNPTPTSTNLRGFGGGSLFLNGTAGAITISRDLSLQGLGPISDRGAALISAGNNILSGTVSMGVPFGPTAISTRIISSDGALSFTGTLNVGGVAGTTINNLGGVNQAGASFYNITGVLTGTGTLEGSGGGTLVLNPSDASGFSGTIRVSGSAASGQSVVRISSPDVLGTRTAATTGAVIDMNGGILAVLMDAPSVNAGGNPANVYQRASSQMFFDASPGGTAVNGTATFGNMTFEDNITTTFTSRNGFSATFGTANVNGGNANSTFTNNFTGGGLLTINGNLWSNVDNGASRTFTLGGNGNTLINGNINGTSAAFNHNFTKTGTGTLTITSTASTLDGNFNINGGTVAVNSFGAFGPGTGTGAASVNIGSGGTAGTLTYLGAGETPVHQINLASTSGATRINASGSGALVIPNDITVNGGAAAKTFTLGGVSLLDNTIQGAIPNGGVGATTTVNVTKADEGTWVLAGANTYTGNTTITEGRLKVQASGATNVIADVSNLVFNADGTDQTAGGTFEYVGVAGENNVETLGVLTPTQGMGRIRLTPGAGGTASLTFSSLGGVSSLGQSINVIAPTALDIVTITGQPTGFVRASVYYNGSDFAYSDSGVLRAPNYVTDPGFVTSGSALTDGAHNEVTGGVVAGAPANISSLKISGSQTIDLGANLLTINHGANTTGGILVAGGTATITGAGGVTQGLGLTGSGGGALVIRVDGVSDVLNLDTPITNSTVGGLTKSGLGTLVLSQQNNQNGNTEILEGTIQLVTGGRLSPANRNLVIRKIGTLDLNGISTGTSIAAFNGAGLVTNTSLTPAVLTVGNNNGTGTFSGIIQDGASQISVVKQGTGGQTWNSQSGVNTYSGSTTINSTGIVSADLLANIGEPSSIGTGDDTSAATNAASLIFGGASATGAQGGLSYTGTANVTIDRLFTLAGTAANSGARLQGNGVNGAGILWGNTAPISYTAAAATVAQNLTLSGASAGDNQINLQLVDPAGAPSARLQVRKQDAGTWVLGNTSNSYTGRTTVNQGRLIVDALSLPATSPLVFTAVNADLLGGVLHSSGTLTRTVTATPVDGVGTVSFLNSGAVGVGQAGSGGFASSQGKLTVDLGSVTWDSGGFMTAGSAAATLRLNSAIARGEVEIASDINLNGAQRTILVDDNTSAGSDFATMSGVLSGVGAGINKTGAGILSFTGANTYTGNTNVTAGTLVVGSLGNSGSPGATSVGDSTAGNSDAGAITLGNGGTGGAILEYIGQGETSDRKIRLNSTTGSTQIHADGTGPLILTNVANDMVDGTKTFFLRGTNAAGNRVDSILTDATAGAATGVLSVTVDGSATWILNAANTYSGTTTSGAGALGIANDAALGTSTLVLTNGNIFAHGADRTIANTVNHNNNTTQGFLGDFSLTFTNGLTALAAGNNFGTNNNIVAGKSLTFNGVTANSLTANRTWTIDGSGRTVIAGDISNTSTTAFGLAIIKSGTGTLVLNGTGSNFTRNGANLDIDNGTVELGASEVIPHGAGFGNVVFTPDNNQNETPVLNLNGFSETINGLTATATSASAIDNASGTAVTLTIGAGNGVVNFNGAITATGGGAISLVKTGTAAGVLSGSNIAIGGTTTVQTGGSLAFTGADPSTTTGIVVEGGAGLSLINGAGSSFASLTSLNLGAGAGSTALGLDAGTITDTLGIAGAAVTAGTVNLSIGAAAGFGGSPTYTLLQAASGLSGATYALNGVVPGGFTYSLSTSDTSVVLNATATTAGTLFWTGDINGSWSAYNAGNTNWEDSGGTDSGSNPGPLDVVVFSSPINLPAGQAVVTTLDLPVAIDSLQFNGNNTPGTAAARVAIAPGVGANTLTISPFLPTDGIELGDGGGIASITAPIVLAADQTWNVGSGGALRPELIVTGVLSGTGSLTKIGAGTATVTGNSTRTGKTAINAGTLRINNEAALGADPGVFAADHLSINGGILRSTATFVIDDANRGITLGSLGGTFDTATGIVTVANVITGPGSLTKVSGNTLVLDAVNTYAGGTFINGGALRAGVNGAIPAGTITMGASGAVLELADGVNVSNAISVTNAGNDKAIRLLAGAAAAEVSGDITLQEDTFGNFRVQASGAGVLTMSGAILNGTGTVARGVRINEVAANNGTVIFSSPATSDTYRGTTEIRNGTLRNGASDVIGTSTAATALTVNASVAASPTATYSTGDFNETIGTLTFGANGSSNAAYVNTVTTGTGTLTLGGNVVTNANPGGSQVSTAVLSGNVAMAATRTFTVANATSVETDLLVSAAVTGAGGLTKAGNGTMELSGTSNYAGTTTINAGTLLVTGSITGAVTTAGGTLGGTGSVGAITANTGTVAPGSSVGTLTATSLTMGTGATFALEINTSNQTTDLLSTTGALTLGLNTPLTVADLGANVSLTQGTKFTFITYSGAQTGLFSFAGNPINDDVDSFLLGVNLFAIDYNDAGGTAVSLVVVPEPGIAASLLGGFGMLVGLQRIRRRSDRRS